MENAVAQETHERAGFRDNIHERAVRSVRRINPEPAPEIGLPAFVQIEDAGDDSIRGGFELIEVFFVKRAGGINRKMRLETAKSEVEGPVQLGFEIVDPVPVRKHGFGHIEWIQPVDAVAAYFGL